MVSSAPKTAESQKRRSSDPISWYLSSIGRVPLLTPAEEIELGNQVQTMMNLTEDGLKKDESKGKYQLGGCCISSDDPAFSCNNCGHMFGYRKHYENEE